MKGMATHGNVLGVARLKESGIEVIAQAIDIMLTYSCKKCQIIYLIYTSSQRSLLEQEIR